MLNSFRGSKKNCPECGHALGATAFKCPCGWKSDGTSDKNPSHPCAHMHCIAAAACSVPTPTGRANLCREHYAAHWTNDVLNAHYVVKPSTLHMEEVHAAYMKKVRL